MDGKPRDRGGHNQRGWVVHGGADESRPADGDDYREEHGGYHQVGHGDGDARTAGYGGSESDDGDAEWGSDAAVHGGRWGIRRT